MQGFNFEKNLPHQSQAVDATLRVFADFRFVAPSGPQRHLINPSFDLQDEYLTYRANLRAIMRAADIEQNLRESNILDIMMETGTGKTYTYAKTMFELNRQHGIFKFIITVPTLSIKAGTVDFLRSDSARQHFKEQYGKVLKLHIVESKKAKKGKKDHIPPSVSAFVNAADFDKDSIQVLLINAGMLNSDTMQKSYDRSLFDQYTTPFAAIAATRPFLIIDEPHKFSQANKTWQNIKQLQAQAILRYGATFIDKDRENLIYELTAVHAFANNLVKGVTGHITEFTGEANSLLRLLATDGVEASFELQQDGQSKKAKLSKGESLEKMHPAMTGLLIDKLSKTEVLLSNGLSLAKGASLSPYSYSSTLQEMMIGRAVREHFLLERDLLTREVKIKPLTLFFIDNIDEYRHKDGYLRQTLETCIRHEVSELLKTESNPDYRALLEQALANVNLTHGGYFSKDNAESDELIEQEINEILHDKQAVLALNNPRRFILSKWTLREGWDNPNVFQICKLRSSGSEISKLQEVGRGLRLPVNQYGNRVKDEQFYLNYFVDFTEKEFVAKLRDEINSKSHAISIDDQSDKLSNDMLKQISGIYGMSEERVLETLDRDEVITRTNNFKADGFAYIKSHYPLIFTGVGSNKIRNASDIKQKVTVRVEKYPQLKELWEKLNEKVILEYKIKSEASFAQILRDFFASGREIFHDEQFIATKSSIAIQNHTAVLRESSTALSYGTGKISTLAYTQFVRQLADAMRVNLKTLHAVLRDLPIDINDYLNATTIRNIKQNFDSYLLHNAIDQFGIEYRKVTNRLHPTALTNQHGQVHTQIDAYTVGGRHVSDKVADSYLLEELFFDSELERVNIQSNIDEVVVFTKIPKNSIKIPITSGLSYSPDFAYVLNFKDGAKKLYFVVETKDTTQDGLRSEEKQKIRHAELFFGDQIKITFKTQFSNRQMAELIGEVYGDGAGSRGETPYS